MEHLKKLKNIKVEEWLFYLLVFSLFFPIRKVLDFGTSNLLGQHSDFTSVSIYLSDILVFILIFSGFYSKWLSLKFSKLSIILISLIFICFFVNFPSKGVLLFYGSFKALELVIIFELIFQYYSKIATPRGRILNFALILGFFQVSLEIFQFLFRKSLGLFYFGESHLSTSIYGVAKLVAHGTTYLRGYGTFPHPNLLSAFLVVLILAYISQYYTKTYESYKKIAFRFIGLFFLIFGLFVTFSRAGLLSFALGMVFMILFWFYSKVSSKLLKNLSISLFGSILISVFILWPIFNSRLTISDNAIKERGFYNQVAYNIIKDKPLTGLGVNQTLIHMQQYSPTKLEPWEIQPIHNYYLALTAEVGIPIALGFFAIFFYLFISLIKIIWNSKNNFNSNYIYKVALASILLSIFVLMFFDHYFYTLQQTQVLLWIILGLITAEIKKPLGGEV